MPELPEVETTVRGLARYLEGTRIARVSVNRPDLRRPFPPIIGPGAHRGESHHTCPPGQIRSDPHRSRADHDLSPRHVGTLADRAGIVSKNTIISCLRPLRAMCWRSTMRVASARSIWSKPPGSNHSHRLPHSGPNRLVKQFTPAHLARSLAGRATPIKVLLLDQRIVAGLGNIYVCEALHRAGIRPDRAAGSVPRRSIERLVPAIRQVLAESIEAGGSTIRDYAQPSGELGYFAASWRVYGREGQPCSCSAPVLRFVQGGRSTFWCPKCQR